MTIKEKYKIYDEDYYQCIKDLIESDLVIEMDNYIQHGVTTTLSHCIDVSYKSYKLAKILKLNYVAVARAGLLHDFYLYDWHDLEKANSLFEMHGYTHPGIALKNAKNHFSISKLEADIIEKHMWPLTLRKIPKYKESVLVSFVDKYTSTRETLYPYFKTVKDYV